MNRHHHGLDDGALETRLRQMLGAQAESVDVGADFTRPAIARRKRTQRRRMIAAGIAGAAALAVAIPIGANLIPQSAPLTPGTGTGTHTGVETALDSTVTEQPTDPEPTADSEPTGTTLPESEDAVLTAEQIVELAPYAVGNTLHLPTGSFSLAEDVQVTGLVLLQPDGALPNGNALVWTVSPERDERSLVLIPVGTDSAPIPITPAEVVVAQDGSAFTTNDGSEVRVHDTSGAVIATRSIQDHTVLAIDDSTVYSFNALTWGDALEAWNYRTDEVSTTLELPALTSDDGRFEAQYTFDDRELTRHLRDLRTGADHSEGSSEAISTINPQAFSADGGYLYSVRGQGTSDLTRTSDGGWISPTTHAPISQIALSRDRTGVLAVLSRDSEDGTGLSALARCDLELTSCETVSDEVQTRHVDASEVPIGAYVVAAQH